MGDKQLREDLRDTEGEREGEREKEREREIIFLISSFITTSPGCRSFYL